nr:immunoglobulin heavy chain junction region [Macaca mulatta]
CTRVGEHCSGSGCYASHFDYW